MLPRDYKISEPLLDGAESNMDFSKLGQSPEYGFFRTRLEFRISIFGRLGGLPCVECKQPLLQIVSKF